MWVKTNYNSSGKDGDDQALINLDTCDVVTVETIGSVGRIKAYACGEGRNYTLGEYKDYAAKEIFDQISLFIGQKETYFMPEEELANERYKEGCA